MPIFPCDGSKSTDKPWLCMCWLAVGPMEETTTFLQGLSELRRLSILFYDLHGVIESGADIGHQHHLNMSRQKLT